MVNIINVAGIVITAPSTVDLTNLLEDKIARLIAVRTLGKADQPLTLSFTGSALALTFAGSAIAQTFAGSAEAAHRHNILVEASNPAAALGTSALMGVSAPGQLYVQTPLGSSLPTAAQLAGGFTPSGAITTPITPVGTLTSPVTPVGTIGAQTVGSLAYTNWTIDANGLLTTGTAAAGHARLVGANRRSINFGSNLTDAFQLQLQVLYMKEGGGVF